MKIKLILTSIICVIYYALLVACEPSSRVAANNVEKGTFRAANERYVVYRIDSLNNVYIVYAKKDSVLYKIVSLKDTIKCKQVVVGGEYSFVLMSRIPKTFNGKDVSPNQVPHVTGIMYYGNWIKFERDSINDIFSSINLKGLCIQ